MITLKQLKIDAAATLGDTLFVVRVVPTYVYHNGVATSERDGTRYTVASAACGMATVTVKVPGPQTVTLGENAVLPVAFDELEIYIFFRDGKPLVAGRAKAIKVLDSKA